MADETPVPHPFTHLDEEGHAHMVDVSAKLPTRRKAMAEGEIIFSAQVIDHLRDGRTAKGDLFTVAKLAGIMAAKRTAELIPLCHPLPLAQVDIRFCVRESERKILVRSEVTTVAPTGVEMEALTAVSTTLLTLYDMTKSSDKSMIIGNIRLIYKEGGKSGTFINTDTGAASDFEETLPTN